jgi:TIR domain-containing protein
MPQDSSEKFHVFVSHKHEDRNFALTVKKVLEGLSRRIDCFVSASDVSAGSDWNIEIRSQLARSHLLILVFTEPSRNWDWCLFEAGLFTSVGMAEDRSVVCLYRPQGASPRPLSNLQGVPVQADALQPFLNELCKETWRIARDWRLGALAPRVARGIVEQASTEIIEAFAGGALGDLTYYPCHRLVLDLGAIEDVGAGIPRDALIIEGDGATSAYTLTLFNLAHGQRARTWGELVDAAGGADASWLDELDHHFVDALNEQLFSPSTTMIQLWDPWRLRRRGYRPILYAIAREGRPRSQGDAVPARGGRPLKVTIVLDPVAGTDE